MKLSPLHGAQIEIRYKAKKGCYKVFVAGKSYKSGEALIDLSAQDGSLHLALIKLGVILSRFPQIVNEPSEIVVD